MVVLPPEVADWEPRSALLDEGQTERLIDDLFGLGQYNLYGAFDAGGTVTYYRRLLASLAGSGIKPPPAADIQNW